jgi:hypothetical protein
MSQPICTFTNTDAGVKAYVVPVPTGYGVSVEDTDSGEFLPSVMIYGDLETAIAYAKKCAGIQSFLQAVAQMLEREGLLSLEWTGEDLDFSQATCECCASDYAGERYEAVGLLSLPPNRVNRTECTYSICGDCLYYFVNGEEVNYSVA